MKAPVIIKLNGVLIESDIDGVESFEVTYRESDEQGVLTKSYSTELTFYGVGYNLLRAALIDNPNGFIAEVRAEVFDECCGRLVLDGIIRGDSIDWCEPECWIKAQIIEKTPELDCIKSTLITDNSAPDFFMNRPQKKLRYCVEMRPQFITEILLAIYSILSSVILVVLIPIAAVVVIIQTISLIICSIICAVPGTPCNQDTCEDGDWTNPENAWREITGWLDDFQNRLIQCQFYHPTALVRDYIDNVCRKCGLTFESSILNDPASPYYNLLLFSAPVRRGYNPSGTEPRLIADNAPLETLDTLFQRHLKPLFNARYWIIDGVLIFERRDYFQNSNTWIDAENLLNNGEILDNRICLSWIDDEKYAYGKYTYLQDGADLLAYEAADRFNTVVEWNDPPSAAQKGFMDNQFQSGIARFRDDRAGWEATGFGGLANAALQNAIANSRDTLLMSQHTAFNYKFLIWDEFSGDETARIKRDYSTGFTGGDVIGDVYYNVSNFEELFENVPLDPTKLFNYPMWFNENNTNNLYTLFHYINNPRTPGNRLYNFSFEFEFDCAQFDAISFSKNIRLKVGSVIKFGEIKELKIDFMKRTIDVSGIV
jgi:hypothetical protein